MLRELKQGAAMDLSKRVSKSPTVLLVELSPHSLASLHAQHPQFVTAIVGLAVVLTFFFFMIRPYNRHRLPPGPPALPIIGNLHNLSIRLHQDFERLSKKYGPIVHMRLGSKDAIVVSCPKIAAEMLNNHDVVFGSRPYFASTDILQYGMKTVTSAPYGHFSRHVKKMLVQSLLTCRRIQQYQNVRKEEVLNRLSSIIKDGKVGKSVCVVREVNQLLMNNFTRMMMNTTYFGLSDDSSETSKIEGRKMAALMDEFLNLSGQFVAGDFVPLLKPLDYLLKHKMRASAKQNDKFFQGIIDERRRQLGSNQQKIEMDMLDILLTVPTRNEAGEEERPCTDDEIKGCLLMAVLMGRDTASDTVEWAMTQLLKHPHIMKKAQDELDAVVGRDRLVEEADIPKLKYFRLIVNEVYRLHPANPLMLPHQSSESSEIGGYHIPVNSQVYFNIYTIQRDPEVWERPLEFNPERFLSSNIDIRGHYFELLPFGAGRRSCPGKALAIVLVDYILATMLHSCNWSLPPGVSPQDVDLDVAPAFGLQKLNSLEALATPRLPMDVIFGSQH